MAIQFLNLTDTVEIRSVLGIDETDITDSVMTDRNLDEDLRADLLTWVPTYAAIVADGVASGATTDQELKYLKLKLYAKYFLSGLVVSAGINSILQKESDGANEGSRFTNIKLTDLQDTVNSKAEQLKQELLNMINATVTTAPNIFGISTPTYDPVTNG